MKFSCKSIDIRYNAFINNKDNINDYFFEAIDGYAQSSLHIFGDKSSGKSSTFRAICNTNKWKLKYDETNMIAMSNNLNIIDFPITDRKEFLNKVKKYDKNVKILLYIFTLDSSNPQKLLERISCIIDNNNNRYTSRIFAINKCDLFYEKKYWDEIRNEPNGKHIDYIHKIENLVEQYTYKNNGIGIKPIIYSSGSYDDSIGLKPRPWNIHSLLHKICWSIVNSGGIKYIANTGEIRYIDYESRLLRDKQTISSSLGSIFPWNWF